MESHLGQLLTNVSRHSFSHHDDNTAVQEPKTNWATLQYNNIFNNNGDLQIKKFMTQGR